MDSFKTDDGCHTLEIYLNGKKINIDVGVYVEYEGASFELDITETKDLISKLESYVRELEYSINGNQ